MVPERETVPGSAATSQAGEETAGTPLREELANSFPTLEFETRSPHTSTGSILDKAPGEAGSRQTAIVCHVKGEIA